MHATDWVILLLYLAAIVGLSIRLGRRQQSADDYFLAGRRMGSWPIALSILATQVSAVSLIGAPAFIALKADGGLRWLQYELAVPVAMIVLIAVFVPRLLPLGITTLYDFVQMRFGSPARFALSVVFLLSRGLSTAVALYAASVVLAVCLNLHVGWAMLLLAMVTIVYTTIGGIEADIYSDIIQMFVLAGGTVVALVVALLRVRAGVALLPWTAIDASRLQVVDFQGHGFGDGQTFAFLPMLFGGVFLYVSYYGCDQSQVQRLLTAANERAASLALLLNGLLRFPFALLYCLFGVVLIGFLAEHPEFAATIPAGKPDYLVPMFVLEFMPVGVTGLVIAAIFAAAMSSFDSAFNSMSAVTLRNLLGRTDGEITIRQSRLWTFIWGAMCTACGYAMIHSRVTVIELINMIGSAFYGPILALFVLGLLSKRASQSGVLAGLAAGVGGNVLLWLFAPGVSWLWWNPIGFTVTAGIGLLWQRESSPYSWTAPGTVHKTLVWWTVVLVGGFLVMAGVCVGLEYGLRQLVD